MARRRSNVNLPPDWHEYLDATVNGRLLAPGTEVSVRGERGRFRFIKRVRRDDGREWLDFWGGPKGAAQWRSFPASQVRRVHRINTTPENLLKERKEARRADRT